MVQRRFDPGDARMKRAYVSALIVEVLVLLALWSAGRYFS
jgi:hypothetical protein